ncbi:MAG TPA: hypothetical protein PLI95_05860, partial [Polyangiaceae bacterium]|nr:hypothetical protein [Polyangiaceae bacterium]
MRTLESFKWIALVAMMGMGGLACAKEEQSLDSEPTGSAEQAILSCSMNTVGMPCDLPSPGINDCGGVCWVNTQGNAACVPLTEPSLPPEFKDNEGKPCQGTTGSQMCSKRCQNGSCVNQKAVDGTACMSGFNPGNQNTCGQYCQNGSCIANPTPCDYGRTPPGTDNCIFFTCDPRKVSSCVKVPLAQDTSCSDGNACTGTPAEKCDAKGACVPGAPKNCSDNNTCTTDTCDTITGTCGHAALADGTDCDDKNACTLTDQCKAGNCAGADPVVCGALDQCHNAGTCNPTDGLCSNPAKPNDTPCDDNDLCTKTDSCQSGNCTGEDPVVCSALDACHVAGSCDKTTGQCSDPLAPDGTTC